MNESLDPKLRDFEKRLRTLRPLEVDLSSPEPIRTKPKQRQYFRNVFVPASVSAMVLLVVVVTMFYAAPKQTVVETPEPVVVVVASKEPVFSTVRSQLVSLLNEMPPTSMEPVKRSDDPVIEITVSRSPVEYRNEFSGILRGGSRVDFDPEKPFGF